jgi:hypothetical protein
MQRTWVLDSATTRVREAVVESSEALGEEWFTLLEGPLLSESQRGALAAQAVSALAKRFDTRLADKDMWEAGKDLEALQRFPQEAAANATRKRRLDAVQASLDAAAAREAAADAARARAERAEKGTCYTWYYPGSSICGLIWGDKSECAPAPSSLANSVCRDNARQGSTCSCP